MSEKTEPPEHPAAKWTGDVRFTCVAGYETETQFGHMQVCLGKNEMILIKTKSKRTGRKQKLGLSRQAAETLAMILAQLLRSSTPPNEQR